MPLLADGHVHFHRCFDAGRFLDAAAGNFAAAARELGLPAGTGGLLFLTETAGDHAFERFRDGGVAAGSGWSVEPTAEPRAVRLQQPGRIPLVLVAGRQIVTREGLEVLALGCLEELPDGGALADTVAAVRTRDAVAVLPWGFGKWLGRRGRILAEFLQSPDAVGVLLGDNGGRLALAPRPRPFEDAAARGVWVIPGSDPLPFPSQESHAGRYGFLLEGAFDPARPAASAVRCLQQLEAQPCTFGRLENLSGFLRSQLRMQLRKPRRPRAAVG